LIHNLSFNTPWILAGMIIILPLALSNNLSPLAKRIRSNLPKPARMRLIASRFFFYLFLCFLITALAGPRWNAEQASAAMPATMSATSPAAMQGEYRRAVDAVIAVDVSRSMFINDGKTAAGSPAGVFADEGVTRLKQGILIVKEAVAALPGMRFAVAISRNRGILAIPLTWDDGAVLAFLETIDSSSLTGRGTNLESLLEASAETFQTSHPSSRVILLVSDGEELTGSIKNALSLCNRNNIIVSTILTGSDEGAPVPSVPGTGNEDIISRRDAAVMRMAAGQTGGVFIDGNREDAANLLIGHLRSLAMETEVSGSKETNKECWFVFLLLAIAAYGLSKASLLNLGRP